MKAENEVFELCKEVYKRTGGWGTEESALTNHKLWHPEYSIPIYTSDYLLEKLPRTVKFYGDPSSMSGSGYSYLSIERPVASNWCASYKYEGYPMHCGFGDTPLEALLKLTLKLHEEKML